MSQKTKAPITEEDELDALLAEVESELIPTAEGAYSPAEPAKKKPDQGEALVEEIAANPTQDEPEAEANPNNVIGGGQDYDDKLIQPLQVNAPIPLDDRIGQYCLARRRQWSKFPSKIHKKHSKNDEMLTLMGIGMWVMYGDNLQDYYPGLGSNWEPDELKELKELRAKVAPLGKKA